MNERALPCLAFAIVATHHHHHQDQQTSKQTSAHASELERVLDVASCFSFPRAHALRKQQSPWRRSLATTTTTNARSAWRHARSCVRANVRLQLLFSLLARSLALIALFASLASPSSWAQGTRYTAHTHRLVNIESRHRRGHRGDLRDACATSPRILLLALVEQGQSPSTIHVKIDRTSWCCENERTRRGRRRVKWNARATWWLLLRALRERTSERRHGVCCCCCGGRSNAVAPCWSNAGCERVGTPRAPRECAVQDHVQVRKPPCVCVCTSKKREMR